MRLDIAKAAACLSMLRVAIYEARSDTGLAAVRSARAENSHLPEKNLLAERAACANQVALGLAGRHGHQVGVFLLDRFL